MFAHPRSFSIATQFADINNNISKQQIPLARKPWFKLAPLPVRFLLAPSNPPLKAQSASHQAVRQSTPNPSDLHHHRLAARRWNSNPRSAFIIFSFSNDSVSKLTKLRSSVS
jgi:hypothetical protein